MKKYIAGIVLCVVFSSTHLHSQNVLQPWHVADNGGGKSNAGGVFLHASIGQPAIQSMSADGMAIEGGYLPGIRILSGASSVLDISAETGWNLVSVPFIVPDSRKSVLYPAGTSAAFAYTGSYQPKDTMKTGLGYWIKFPVPAAIHFTGRTIVRETVQVNNNWNIIGAMSFPTLASDITPLDTASLVSNFYGYSSRSGYYPEDTLKPGVGYWIKVRNAGKLVIRTGLLMMDPTIASRRLEDAKTEVEETRAMERAGTLTIRDAGGRERELYVSSDCTPAELNKWEMPPVPFEGMMDARFATNRMLERGEASKPKEVGIRISAAEYPVTLSWKVGPELAGATLRIDEKEVVAGTAGEVRITNPASRISVRFTPLSGKELPKQFALHQNYPNPFNPTTTIRFDLPRRSHVRIVIYDALGEEIDEILSQDQEAGYQTIEWKGTNAGGNSVASGMYFYRIEAKPLVGGEKFTEVRKMLLVR